LDSRGSALSRGGSLLPSGVSSAFSASCPLPFEAGSSTAGRWPGTFRPAPRRGSHPHRPSTPWSWLSCSWELLRFVIPQSTRNCGRWRELSHRSYRVKTPILLSASQPFGRACNPHMRTASFRAAPEFTHHPVGTLNRRRASVWLRKEVLEKGHIVAPSQTLPDAMGNWTLRRGSRTRRASSSLSISAGKFISVKSTLMSKRAFSAR